MPGLVPGIPAVPPSLQPTPRAPAWMAGTSPAVTGAPAHDSASTNFRNASPRASKLAN
jgi:hypothetical protein